MGIVITNQAEFDAGLDAFLQRAEADCLVAYKGMVAKLFDYVVLETPQWSGQTAVNWRIGVGTVDTSYRMDIKDDVGTVGTGKLGALGKEVYESPWVKAGHPDEGTVGPGNPIVITGARFYKQRGLAKILSLTQPVYISNSTPFDKGQTAAVLEDGPSWLRDKNQPGAMVSRAVSWFNSRWGVIPSSAIPNFRRAYGF